MNEKAPRCCGEPFHYNLLFQLICILIVLTTDLEDAGVALWTARDTDSASVQNKAVAKIV